MALIVGLVWGIWVRWFPSASDEAITTPDILPALIALAVGLLLCGLIRLALPPADIYRREDWRLTRVEWGLMGAILWAAMVISYAQDNITGTGLGIVVVLGGLMLVMLYATVRLRNKSTLLEHLTPPRRPNIAAWVILIVPFLLAGWAGYSLPGSGDSSIQGDLLVRGADGRRDRLAARRLRADRRARVRAVSA